MSEKALMDDERTPLIQTVRVAPIQQRYPHSTVRRFCTSALGACLFVILILWLLPVSVLYEPPFHFGDLPASRGISYKRLQEIFLSVPTEEKVREWSRYYTSGPHLAGKNYSQVVWTKDLWQEFGIENTNIVAYDAYINYPLGHRLALLQDLSEKAVDEDDESTTRVPYRIIYEASLEEDIIDEDSTTSSPDRIPTFHGYSATGNVTAQYVYVNFGTYDDYDDLIKANVSLEGKIAIAKYGRIFRGLKVKRAQELGMVGVVLYTDPQEDGEITEQNGYDVYPYGPARHPSAVQRGSTQFLSFGPGDPTTPGYPSKPGVPRQSPNYSIPSIPSIPISYRDALPFLLALNGQGPNVTSFNKWWQGGGLSYKGVQYNIGPSPPGIVINLVNEQDYVTTPIWNVVGIVNGTIPDQAVILGNHHDSWIVGGAGDPNSGSAILNEVVRAVGTALKHGWKPMRTIVFASWDGEEYGLVGSTEWVEEYLPWLSQSALAYLNVDVGVSGDMFKVDSSPLLNGLMSRAASLVASPNQTVPNQTVFDAWDKSISTLGSGSDYTAFLDYAGVTSINFGFGPSKNSAVYQYHSNYDSFYWMDKFADPGWHYHVAVSKLWGLLAADLIDTPVVGVNTTDYAVALQSYIGRIESKYLNNGSSILHKHKHRHPNPPPDDKFDLHPLRHAASKLLRASLEFSNHQAHLSHLIANPPPWWHIPSRLHLYRLIARANRKAKNFERTFLHERGLNGRSWFKHTVYAPGRWTGYAGETFPGLAEALEDGDLHAAVRWRKIIERGIDTARMILDGEYKV